ncbi:SDR family NAD(P)-dependent oxidoreductase [Pseudomonas syringae]|uniref:Glucose dehydrogenase n=4 Tax=Pseudomonas syringae TaxID=317 RepID=A0A656JVQ4_PSESF|nr:glucose 1-dehydrogenase [Pseudomonas syringae]EPN56835.1 glucose dehydrogenase [Pseudomonas syringae pv. actinidiae ICMP 19096]EPM47424.1 glucose dehydrogenase [Pseudomonas syringae pv. actinidiae ICMP 19098]EPN18468.1 glucose dehydrogenase [Pseudomonas syringae pv. actinidiae ICMP 19100]EPN25923.1 glucose dehydrogenase [Pseudomonas syringae pv. actinidiae ICMP 19099]EPN33998.1 glucose dehydrogenase [Pseudomonas syringae pv. actinidiae ICMP 18883]
MSRLQGKIAVITGGSSGIGLATAQRFVDEGAYVFITGRRQPELDKAVARIGRNVTAVQGDVSSSDDLDRLYEVVRREKGSIDVLFANAGIMQMQPLDGISSAHYDTVFDTNVKGLLFSVQKALVLMRDGGSIILNASIAASRGVPGCSTYSAAKAAIRSFARTWTAELQSRGIRVNTLSPGPIDTPIMDLEGLAQEHVAQMKAALVQGIPLGRLGRPDEVAAAALFLASDDSSFIAGIDLCVDGGKAQI